MRKILVFLLVFCFIATILPMNLTVSASTSGYYKYEQCEGVSVIVEVDHAISGDVIIPEMLGGYPVVAIREAAFSECSRLESITMPNSVKFIGEEAFYDCTGLTNVVLSKSVNIIGSDAFAYCNNLTSINIPDSVISIGEDAFYDCSNLKDINVSDNVMFIGSSAFFNTAYYNTSANWEDGVLYIGNHLIAASQYTLPSEYKIKSGTKTIAEGAFSSCESLENIDIPKSIISIGERAFYNCSNLANIEIPDSVEYIGGDIGYYYNAFYGTAYYNTSANWEDGVLYIGNHLIAADKEKVSDNYEIKNGTKTIAGGAFYGVTSLKSITFPESIISIGEYAFYACHISTIPNKVKYIGEDAFSGCSFKSLMIPSSVKYIGEDAFAVFWGSGIPVHFENTSDWSAGGIELSPAKLADTKTAAEYLIDTYSDFCWLQPIEINDEKDSVIGNKSNKDNYSEISADLSPAIIAIVTILSISLIVAIAVVIVLIRKKK